MSRNVILAVGAVLWTTLAVSAFTLYAVGHWMPPTLTIIVGIPLVTARLIQRRSRQVA